VLGEVQSSRFKVQGFENCAQNLIKICMVWFDPV
jgi:hypothetical protein